MKEIKDMLTSQLGKMASDGSVFFGAIGGALAFAVPEWIYGKSWTLNHTIVILILLGIILSDWFVGRRLAQKAGKKTSETAIDAAVRDVIILGVCAAGYGLDYVFGTGSIIFAFIVAAFIYHNFYSVMANIVVLGWGKHFPVWVIKWLDNEIKAKVEKYFPEKNKKE